jgi:hypothetical protein
MDYKKYIIFDLSEVDNVNFNHVLQTSKESLRISSTNKSILKYEGETPSLIQNLTTKSKEFTYDEILVELNNPEWN